MDDKSLSEAPVRSGDVLGGKYRVDQVLGVGGMGVVVAATHLHLDQRVALKFLLPEAQKSAEIVQRFAREARAAVRIRSEHVARVLDVGSLDTGAPFMVMEFLEGADLADLVRKTGALPTHAAVDLIVQACDAIAEAHVAGIVHRDLKPANLFVARYPDGSPLVKVLDFGISKVALADEGSMTKTTAMMGSPLYMSPEHLNSSRDVDQRTDIWALGIILHEMLAGRVPFSADTMPQLCVKIMSSPPPPIRMVRPDVAPGVEAVILRCLERDRERRYPNVGELVRELAPFGGARTALLAERILRVVDAHGPMSSGAPPQPIVGGSDATVLATPRAGAISGAMAAPNGVMTGFNSGHTQPPARSSRGMVVGAVLALALGGVAGAGYFTLAGNAGRASSARPAASAEAPAPATAPPPAPAPVVALSAPPTPASAPSPVVAQAIQIHLQGTPKETRIFIDEAAVPGNPYQVSLRPDGAGHKIRFEAAGHEPQSHYVVYDKDLTLKVELKRRAGAAPSPNNGGSPLYDRPF